MNQVLMTFVEWFGAILSLIGAFLLATNSKYSKYGWVLFLLSNFLWAGFALAMNRYGLLIQNVGFTCTSILGMIRSGLLTNYLKADHDSNK